MQRRLIVNASGMTSNFHLVLHNVPWLAFQFGHGEAKMRLKTLILSMLIGLIAPLDLASAQRSQPSRPAVADSWELLGEQTVAFGVDNDSIVVNQDEEWFRNRAFKQLRFVAERNDVYMVSIRIVYINGYSEDIATDKLIRRGSQLAVDLRGERSFLKQIDMRYRGNFGISFGGGGIRVDQAVVKVYGERVQRRPEPLAEAPVIDRSGWSEIDTKRFATGSNRVVFSSRRGDGRFGQIRLKAINEPVRIRDVQIRFRNGEIQTVPIDSRLEGGDETRVIDLAGEQRFLDTVTVNLEPRRRPGSIELQLIGLRRSGGPEAPAGDDIYTRRGWVLLGEQTVGFTVDRDVINVGQPEEWFRERRFRRLHLIAQRNDVYMRSVRISYLNGYVEDATIDRLVAAGTDTAIELGGERSYIRQIELVYRTRPNYRGQAVMRVYGEPIRR